MLFYRGLNVVCGDAVVEWLARRTLNLKVGGSNLCRRVVFLDKKLCSTLSLPPARCINGYRPHNLAIDWYYIQGMQYS